MITIVPCAVSTSSSPAMLLMSGVGRLIEQQMSGSAEERLR